jgi:hypothetical protein
VSRKVIPAAAIVILLTTGAAFAQVAPLPDNKDKGTKEEQERAASDKAYRDAAKTVPTKRLHRSVGRRAPKSARYA